MKILKITYHRQNEIHVQLSIRHIMSYFQGRSLSLQPLLLFLATCHTLIILAPRWSITLTDFLKSFPCTRRSEPQTRSSNSQFCHWAVSRFALSKFMAENEIGFSSPYQLHRWICSLDLKVSNLVDARRPFLNLTEYNKLKVCRTINSSYMSRPRHNSLELF